MERDRIELVADDDEFIIALPFAEGASIKAGDVIVVQDRSISGTQLDAARAQLAEAEARVDELTNGPRSTTIRAAVARRDSARVVRDQEVRERDRLLELVKRNLVSQSEADKQVSTARAAETLREAEEDLRELQQSTRAEQVAQARKSADSAPAGRSAGHRVPPGSTPVDSIIDALPYHVEEKPVKAPRWRCCWPTRRHAHPFRTDACAREGQNSGRIQVDGVARGFNGQVRFVSSRGGIHLTTHSPRRTGQS